MGVSTIETKKTDAELERLIASFNQTKCEYPSNRTISELFEEQAAKTPDRAAAVFQGQALTYAQLNAKSNQLARRLRKMGVGAEDYVGILAERGAEMLIAMLGVLKAGGAYVPLDPAYPSERISFMLHDCKAKAVLLYKAARQTDVPVIDLLSEPLWQEEECNLPCINQSSDVAYLIFTSGTTGLPKAVMIEHRNVVNYCTQNGFGVMRYADGLSSILSVTNLGFDIFVTETFLALLNGMTVYIANAAEQTDTEAFLRLESVCKAQVLQTTPSRLQMFLSQNATDAAYRHLKYIMVGGEAVSQQLVQRLKQACPQARIVDVYGPSETTVWSTCADVTHGEVTIGKPISNTQIYILNQNELCAIGEVGELCIAGAGLARGYLNREELTKEKFVDNPFGEGRMYRTGDLAKWLPNGDIAFLGRRDEQVKIRGFRIETDEIASVLREHAHIRDCAVIAREDQAGEKELYAYLVSEAAVDISAVRRFLQKKLPSYMVPPYMMQIDAIPVNRNGKLDKKVLPMIETACSESYVAPTDRVQENICKVFGEILGLAQIGITDNFFDMGGHSLRAVRLINSLEKLCGRRLSQQQIFDNPTPQELAKLIGNDTDGICAELPAASAQAYYPLSPAQHRMYLTCQTGEINTSYNLPSAWRITGALDCERLKSAFAQMLRRHEILRTEFVLIDDEPMQKILPEVTPCFTLLKDTTTIEEVLLKSFVQPFDLSRAPLIRMKLIERKDHYLLLLDAHHIISDGMSEETFLRELAALYNGKILPAPKRQYRDYSQYMLTKDISSQEAYWLKRFESIPTPELPLDQKRPQQRSHRGAMVFETLDASLSQTVKAIAKKHGATEYMVFLSAAMILLAKYSRNEDVVIGSAFSGRLQADTENMLGMFVNTLALRAQPEGGKTYREFLLEVRELCLQAYENQEYPFETLIQALKLRREASKNPLFDVMLVLQNNDHTDFRLNGAQISKVRSVDTGATFDLTFNIEEDNGIYTVGLEYCSDLFYKESAQRFIKHFIAILHQLQDDAQQLCNIRAATVQEAELILRTFNNTAAPYPADQTIAELFEQQVRKTPEHIAVVCDGRTITYEALNIRANRLAHKLRALGVRPNDLVAVLTRRSIEMIVAIYGILKAGGAYVPMDPSYPSDRITFMLKDSQPKAVVTYQAALDTMLPILDLEDEAAWCAEESNPALVNRPNDLAYCIYTSGTTGKPKGVLVEHHGVANLKAYFAEKIGVKEDDRVLQFANYVFDGSVWEMNMALLNGARLVISTNNLDIPAFEEMFAREGVTIASLPPNFYAQVYNIYPRILVTAGSASDRGIVEKAQGARYINSYGPTECTVAATHWQFSGESTRIPIGKPIQNVNVYILQGTQLCGIGVPGELCICGAGVARGYLNRDELTAERFIDNPFGEGKLYRTGDLARWLPDGNIDFLGRVDEQAKIRGFRVEPGEIECVLRKIDVIRDCAVVVRKDSHGEDALFAYVTSAETVNFDAIRAEMKTALPDYMIPAYMMQIDAIPVTRNGKLDKRALPMIELRSDSEYIPPGNLAEQYLCEVLCDVLGVASISVKDSFFEFGGDSIKAIRVISKLREKGLRLTVRDIMENATVEEIAIFAQPMEKTAYTQSEVSGTVRDTPVIRQFKQWNLQKPHHFNQSVMLQIEAEEALIQNALDALCVHHDMLRAVLRNDCVEILRSAESLPCRLETFEISENVNNAVRDLCARLQASFDLQNGPLMKAALFKTSFGSHLFICIHHLLIDGISWQIFIEDLQLAIKQQREGKQIVFAPKTASFKLWAELLGEYEHSDRLLSETNYWLNVTKQLASCRLELDRTPCCYAASATLSLTQTETEKLLYDAGKAYNTRINDLLLAALSMAVSHITRQRQIAVCLEGHGREEIHKKIDIDRTIGWFTCAYPVILECTDDVQNAVVNTKEMLRKVPNHGLGYGLVPELDRSEPIDVYFNYLGESAESGVDKENPFDCGPSVAEENRYAGEININCGISNGRFVFDVSCDRASFGQEIVEHFAECYRQKLIEMIEFCCASEESGKTFADVDAEDLDEADFDEINAILGLF